MSTEIKKTKVLISRDFPSVAEKMLRKEGFEVTAWEKDRPMTPEELKAAAMSHQAMLCASSDNIDSAFLKSCKHLELISQFSAGYDNVDIAEANVQKTLVANAPGTMSRATADIAFGLLIATSRKMFHMHKSIAQGNWGYFRPQANLGMELHGKTLGIFGLGAIGIEMAKLCRGAYQMNIIYHNRHANMLAEETLDAKLVSFEALLTQSDVISVHSVLSKDTAGIFNKEAFEHMRPSSIFINTARGPLHNEKDLIEALQNKEIWGAGLDVTNPEPMSSDNPLLTMENVSVLPHIGSATIEARTAMASVAATNIIEHYSGRQIPHLINPEAL